MCCWLLVGWAFAPRVALVLMWLLSDRISRAFSGIIVPLIGFLIMPWTTLTYTLVIPGGLGIIDIVLLVIAVIADVSAWGGGARYRYQQSR